MSFLGHFNCLSDRHPAAACSFHGILTTIACVSFAFSGLKKIRLKEKKNKIHNFCLTTLQHRLVISLSCGFSFLSFLLCFSKDGVKCDLSKLLLKKMVRGEGVKLGTTTRSLCRINIEITTQLRIKQEDL